MTQAKRTTSEPLKKARTNASSSRAEDITPLNLTLVVEPTFPCPRSLSFRERYDCFCFKMKKFGRSLLVDWLVLMDLGLEDVVRRMVDLGGRWMLPLSIDEQVCDGINLQALSTFKVDSSLVDFLG